MKNKNNQSGYLTMAVLAVLVLSNVLLNLQWFPIEKTDAFAVSADEKNGNDNNTINDGTSQGSSDVAVNANGGYVVTWQSFNQDGSGNGIYFRRFTNQGNVIATQDSFADLRVNTDTSGNQNDPAIAMDQEGNFVIVWAGNGSGDNQGIFMQAFDKNGSTIGSQIRVNSNAAGDQYLPSVAIDYNGTSNPTTNPNVVVAWYSCNVGCTDSDIYYRTIGVNFTSPAVTPIGTETLVNTYTANYQHEPSVAMNNFGEFMVSWHGSGSGFTTDDEAWIQAYDNDGTTWGDNLKVNNSSSAFRTDLAADKSSDGILGGNFFISYDGISSEDSDGGIMAKMIPRCTSIGCDISNSLELNVNSSTTGTQIISNIAADGLGNFNVSWVDERADLDGWDIFAQNYKYNKGKPYNAVSRTGSQFRVNSARSQEGTADDEQTEPSVGMAGDGFYVVSFTSYPTGNQNNADVHFQQFVSEMLKNGYETRENPTDGASPISQTSTKVAVSPSGLYATTWIDQADGGVKFTLRDSNNNNAVVGTAGTRVDSPSTGPNSSPSVSFFQDTDLASPGYGRFIIAWEGVGIGGRDVYYREISASGTPLGTETLLSSTITGLELYPKVAAGLYEENSVVHDYFTAIYTEDGNTVNSVFHDDTGTSEHVLFNCTSFDVCNQTAVEYNGVEDRALYAWNEDVGDNDIYVQRANNRGTPLGSPIAVATGDGLNTFHYSPDTAFIKTGNEFVVTYEQDDSAGERVMAKTYNFNTGNPIQNITISTCTSFCSDTNPKVAAMPSGYNGYDGATLFAWDTTPDGTDDNVYGALWWYDDSGNSFAQFSPNFRISSTQNGNQFLPSVDMNNYGDIIVGWEGEWESVPNASSIQTDTEASVSQLLYNPIYAEPLPSLEPSAQQQVEQGGRTISVPDALVFPSVNVNLATSTTQTVSIRDAQNGGCSTSPTLDCTDPASKFIQVDDLDGLPFTLTIVADTDFVNDADGQTYITRNDFSVRNWDQDPTSTPDECGDDPVFCFETVNPVPPPVAPTFALDASTTTFQPLNTSRTLATKTGNDIGSWKIYPDWQLTIPALTPPGTHSTTITVTLQ